MHLTHKHVTHVPSLKTTYAFLCCVAIEIDSAIASTYAFPITQLTQIFLFRR